MSDNKKDPERVPTGRFKRMFAMGKLGASIGASRVTSKIKEAFGGEDTEEKFVSQSADRIVNTLGKLKGASMKIGQFLSTDPELLPDGLAEQLTSLQNAAPPMTFDTICLQIEAAFSLPIDAVFSYFSAEPIGAASIGQVHRATLADSGMDVAVKIQYPAVVESLDDDLNSMKSLMNFGRVVMSADRADAMMAEIREMVLQEANYCKEAQNLSEFNEICKSREGVLVPKPVDQWTRETVLTMQFMEGTKLDEALATIEDDDRKNSLLYRWVATYVWMFHEQNYMHADPHPGNFLLNDNDELVILDFGSVKKFDTFYTDAVLQLLDSLWQDDPYRAQDIYTETGFGSRGLDIRKIDPDVIREMHAIMFEPYYTTEPFDFGNWRPAEHNRRFMLKNMELSRFIPPSELLQYFRLLSGIKGLLARFNGRISITELLIDITRRRGFLTGEPRWERLAELRQKYTKDDTK